MKPSLQLKIGQQLTMTPQLQQAIRLLQLSTLDLQQEIQETLESNPLLEVTESDNEQADAYETDSAAGPDSEKPGEPEKTAEAEPLEPSEPLHESENTDWNEQIPEDLPVDSAWDDVYQSAPAPGPAAGNDDLPDFESGNGETESIQDHLLWQLNLSSMSDLDRVIAMTIIDCVEPDGYLSASIDAVVDSVAQELVNHPDLAAEEHLVEHDEVIAVLRRLQNFDPLGVCARDLQECLLIQLNQLPQDTPLLEKTRDIINNHLNLLGSRDYATLMRRNKIKEPELQAIITLIQSFNPKPGETINTGNPEYVIPDVVVKKEKGRWRVELNPEVMPKLRINAGYASLIKRADDSKDNNYLRNHLQEARWFIKSLQSRNETLLKVATEIIEKQRGFLEHGEEAMKPLVLHDIADAIEMHESTISRVTTQKYLHTPRGIFELKYFFSSHVETDSGLGCSSTAIRAIIKKLIAAEKPKKPLSDNKIADILANQGIKVARRTIAKYRESLSIPPSNERKRLV